MPEATVKPLLLLVDGHSLAFRSFYAFSKGGRRRASRPKTAGRPA